MLWPWSWLLMWFWSGATSGLPYESSICPCSGSASFRFGFIPSLALTGLPDQSQIVLDIARIGATPKLPQGIGDKLEKPQREVKFWLNFVNFCCWFNTVYLHSFEWWIQDINASAMLHTTLIQFQLGFSIFAFCSVCKGVSAIDYWNISAVVSNEF